MNDIVWHYGPPPSIGWWPASLMRGDKVIRWWDGRLWSVSVYESDGQGSANHLAKKKASASAQTEIEWADRPDSWPDRSKT